MQSMECDTYQKITVRNGGHHFSVFCRRSSLAREREDVVFWIDSLARRLGWTRYDMEINDATENEALARRHAQFEDRIRKL